MPGPRKIVPIIPIMGPSAVAMAVVPSAGAVAAAPAAPAAAAPHVQYHGGAVLGSVEVVLIFWGAHWTQAAGAALQARLNAFFDFVLTSAFMDTLQEYSTPQTVIRKGRRIATVNVSASEPGTVTPGGRQVTDAQIQQALQGWIAAGTVPATTANTLYFVYLPPNVVCIFQTGQSCQVFCGYHEQINNAVFYAVEPFVTCPGCSFGAVVDSLTKISSHELAEAVTDPAGTGWWDSNTGDEIGDICNASTTRLGGFLVQNQWSNVRAACVLGAGTPYERFLLQTGTPLAPAEDGNGDFTLADFDRDGIPDLAFIKRRNTGTGKIELHVLSGKSNYQQFVVQTATGLAHAEDLNGDFVLADFDRDGIPGPVFHQTSEHGDQHD